MDSLQQRLTVIVTFVLGFFVSVNVARWWNHRLFLQRIHGSILDTLLILSSAHTPLEHLQEIGRLGMLAQAVLFTEVRGGFVKDAAVASVPSEQPDISMSNVRAPPTDIEAGSPGAAANEEQQLRTASPSGLTGLEPAATPNEWRGGPFAGIILLGLTNSVEAEYLADSQGKAQVVWIWIARYIAAVKQDGQLDGLDPYALAKVREHLCHGRDAVSGITTQLSTHLPFTYVQLVAMIVQCSNLVTALCSGYTIAAAYDKREIGQLWSQVFQMLFIPLTFQSLLCVCVSITNPFGHGMLKFSFLHFHVLLAKQIESFLKAAPPSIDGALPLYRGRRLPARPPAMSCETSYTMGASKSCEMGDVHSLASLESCDMASEESAHRTRRARIATACAVMDA